MLVAGSTFSVSAFDVKLFEQDVRIVDLPDDNDALEIGGREFLRDHIISIYEIAVVDGVPIVIGVASNGGNACAGSPFVLSFPDGEQPRMDGPLDSCSGVGWTIETNSIIFSTSPLPSRPGQTWTWTVDGFKNGGEVAFKPDADRGWNDLRSRQVGHPSELMQLGEVAADIRSLLDGDAASVLPVLDGVGSAEYKGDFLIGKTCQPHNCGGVEAIVAADIRSRQLYVAWKLEGQKIEVRPAVKQWPDTARFALRDWAEKWK